MSVGLRSVGLAAALAAFAAPGPLSSASAEEVRRAAPAVPLVSMLSDEDYPAAAIRSGQQGAVSFRLSIDAAGRVSGCAVLVSSGSESLDSTTCRLMTTRVRFSPAENSSGKPVADTYEGRIVWRLPAAPSERFDLPERPSAAIRLWSACAEGETAKLALSSLAAPEIAGRAFQACAGLEERIVRESEEAKMGLHVQEFVQALKDDFAARLGPRLEEVRWVLGREGQ